MFRFTVRQIEVFLSACEAGSFAGAAQNLGISEAAVSEQVRGLERQLDRKLFVRRRGQKVTLSKGGQRFAESCLEFVRLGRLMGGAEAPKSQPLRLTFAIGRHLHDDLVRPALPDFLRNNPDIELSFFIAESHKKLTEAIVRREIDGAYVSLPEGDQTPGFELIGYSGMSIWAHETLAAQASAKGVDALDFILYAPGADEEAGQLRYLRLAGISQPKIVARIPFHEIAIAQACEGKGAILMLDDVVKHCAPNGRLRQIVSFSRWERRLYLGEQIDPDRRGKLLEFFKGIGPLMPKTASVHPSEPAGQA